MAFSVKQVKAKLQEFGVPAENLDSAAEYFCSAHKTDLDAIKEERDTYKADAAKLPAVQAELDKLKNQPDDGFKAKYEKERDDFEAYKADVEAKATLAAKKTAYTEVCKDAGLNEKGIAKALKYADWDAIELDEAGKVKGAKDHIKALKEEWSEHITTESQRGANTANPPSGKGSGRAMTKDEIMAIRDPIQRQNAIAENLDLFT